MLGVVLKNECIAKEIFELEIKFECADFSGYNCGQFLHIKIPNSNDTILRRPISIFNVNREEKTITVIYKIAGKGTARLALVKPNDMIDALLFLGNGFTIPKNANRVLLIGGGIGTAPFGGVVESGQLTMDNGQLLNGNLTHAADTLKIHPKIEFSAIFGYQTKSVIFKREFFEEHCKELYITTEDGTQGEKGFVTKILEKTDLTAFDSILCCGPTPMLKAIAPLLLNCGVRAFVSLEERMGCGMGGCSVCVCKTASGDYEKVCLSGPVFELGKVEL